jgi:N-acetyl-beta-hexosaminidase
MPELITVCWGHGKPLQSFYSIQGEMEILNPSEPRVYSAMDALLREVKERFPSNYIHLGMDEVYDKCWYVIDRSIDRLIGDYLSI